VIDSNSLGLREKEIAIPKPSGRTRVVILGDSFVFGPGVEMDERLGVHLEAELERRAGRQDQDVEVLHVGLGSWNILAETSFMRRGLSSLDPDLVIHVPVHNDLDDVGGVRGFGSVGSSSPQSPAQLSPFYVTSPARLLSGSGLSFLNAGLSHESRQRYARARQAMRDLSAALRRTGAEYLVCMYWQDHTPTARRLMIDGLDVPTVFLSSEFRAVPEYRIGPADPHWSVEGHRAVATFLYGAIRKLDLLQALRIQPWPEASELFEQEDGRGRAEATDPIRGESLDLEREIRFDALDPKAVRQIYGGVSADGAVGPVGVVLLPSSRAIRIVGRALERPEMAGATVIFSIDGVAVDEIELVPGQRIDTTLQVPPQLATRDAIEIRFDASDFVYAGRDLREPRSMLLERIVSIR
jgi:hypothetical protein